MKKLLRGILFSSLIFVHLVRKLMHLSLTARFRLKIRCDGRKWSIMLLSISP